MLNVCVAKANINQTAIKHFEFAYSAECDQVHMQMIRLIFVICEQPNREACYLQQNTLWIPMSFSICLSSISTIIYYEHGTKKLITQAGAHWLWNSVRY